MALTHPASDLHSPRGWSLDACPERADDAGLGSVFGGSVRVRAVGIRTPVVLENIARAYGVAEAQSGLMNSPGHRAIITDCGLTEAGFSAVSNGDKMTAAGDFGTR